MVDTEEPRFFIACDPARVPAVEVPADWRKPLHEFLIEHDDLPWETADAVYVLRRRTIEDALTFPDGTSVDLREWLIAVVQIRRSERWSLLGSGPVEVQQKGLEER